MGTALSYPPTASTAFALKNSYPANLAPPCTRYPKAVGPITVCTRGLVGKVAISFREGGFEDMEHNLESHRIQSEER